MIVYLLLAFFAGFVAGFLVKDVFCKRKGVETFGIREDAKFSPSAESYASPPEKHPSSSEKPFAEGPMVSSAAETLVTEVPASPAEKTDAGVSLVTEKHAEEPEDKASLTEKLLRENLDKWIVNGGYLNQGLTLEELAAELMTNRTYLSAFINNTYNCTFKDFIYMLRIESAIQIMMENPSISIEDLGTKVGIPSSTTFTRQFIKQMGVTPSVWKMSNLQRTEE